MTVPTPRTIAPREPTPQPGPPAAESTEEPVAPSVSGNILHTGRRAVHYVLLFVLATLPFVSGTQDSGLLMVEGGLLLGMTAVLLPFNETRSMLLAPSLWALVGFIGWVGLTLSHSLNFFHTEMRLGTWITALAVMIAILECHPSRTALRSTVRVLVGIASVYAAACLTATFVDCAQNHTDGTLTLIGFSSVDSACACMIGGLGLALLSTTKHAYPSTKWLVAVLQSALLTLVVLLGGNPASLVGMLGIFVFVVLVTNRGARKTTDRLIVLVGPASAALFLLVMTLMFGPSPLKYFHEPPPPPAADDPDSIAAAPRPTPRPTAEPTPTPAPRLFNAHSLQAVLRAPVAGAGLANTDVALEPVRRVGDETSELDPETILVETGGVGFALLSLVWTTALWPVYRPGDGSTRHGAVASLLGILVCGAQSPILTNGTSLVWTSALLGLAVGRSLVSDDKPRLHVARPIQVAVGGILLVVAVGQVWFGSRVALGRTWLHRAEAQMESRPQEAAETLGRALEVLPNYDLLWLKRGLLWDKLTPGDSRAERDMAMAYQLGPLGADVPFEVGCFYLRHGNLTDAIHILRLAADWFPLDYRRAQALGDAYSRHRDWALAAEAYSRALNGGQPVSTQLGLAFYQLQKQEKRGLATFTDMCKADPAHADAYQTACLSAASSALDDHQPLLASDFLEVLKKKLPDSAQTRVHLASMFFVAGQADDAEAILLPLLGAKQSDETQLSAVTELVAERTARHDLRGCADALAIYLSNNAWNNEARLKLAETDVTLGDVDVAVVLYTEAAGKEPTNARLAERLGDLYLLVGQKHMAVVSYEEAAKLEPANAAYVARAKQFKSHRF